MKVEVVSSEIIKPSSPTAEHLRRYQLSFLDQISPRAHSPFIYYYALNDSVESSTIADISTKLKKSLSQALGLYYPLAGRFTDDYFVECNDDGVHFLEARVVKTKLSDVLNNPVPCELNDLLPFQLDELAEFPLGVQLNSFDCGGIAIGISLSHRIGDALSCLVFIRNWMAIARGEEDKVVPPEFNSALLFPPKEMGGFDPSFSLLKKHTIVTKRFVFNGPKIEALRAKYEEKTSGENNPKRRLSRIEAFSAFLWSRFLAATCQVDEPVPAPENFYLIFHPVNIRPKLDPPLPEHAFGNYFFSCMTIPTPLSSISSTARGEEEQLYCYGLARKIGEEIRRINKECLEINLRVEADKYLEGLKIGTERFMIGAGDGFVLTSLCRFPLYEADFGIGKPAWVSSADRCYKNIIGFLDNKTGDGIEAYVSLKPQVMAKFEADKEFLSLISPIVLSHDMM